MSTSAISYRQLALYVAATSYIIVGVAHFTHAAFFVRIMPPGLPEPLWLVWISGAAEVLGGIGLLIAKTRKAAGYGILALLVAVYPANIYMAMQPELFSDLGSQAALYARLPVQLVFAAWVIWVAQLRHPEPKSPKH
ncbi:MAG TPA: hypothetical protein DCQ06_04930 [Myxococcales bacterium]|nr:hypothetical protein [Myxococcales bacterium]|tara:strand:+ start:22 stop:432 length:411 start_codon:yes stop_codon:yes gene_type:complete